jgi:hypothetical protein
MLVASDHPKTNEIAPVFAATWAALLDYLNDVPLDEAVNDEAAAKGVRPDLVMAQVRKDTNDDPPGWKDKSKVALQAGQQGRGEAHVRLVNAIFAGEWEQVPALHAVVVKLNPLFGPLEELFRAMGQKPRTTAR